MNKKLLSFSLYPNPAKSFAEIIFPGKNEYLEISLFEIQDRLVIKQIARNEPSICLETNLLKSGIY